MAPLPDLLALARQVAERLPFPWAASEDPLDPGVLWGPAAMRIVLSRAALGGRLLDARLPVEVSSSDLPAALRRRCRIRVSFAHDPDALAEAIQQRLLPQYEPLFHHLAHRSCERAAIDSLSSDPPALAVKPIDHRLVRVSVVVPRDALSAVREALVGYLAHRAPAS